MKHDIPPEALNSDILYCIKEYVRIVDHRRILRDKWFRGLSFEQLSGKYHIAVTSVKDIVYDVGDPILDRAAQMSMKNG